jgi:hypothetical protein
LDALKPAHYEKTMNEEKLTIRSMLPESEPRRASTESDNNWEPGVTDAEREAALAAASNDPKQTIFWPVAPGKKLNDISVILLILNRCIGMLLKSRLTVIPSN